MELRSKTPTGPLERKWDKHRFEMKLVNPANKRKYTVIVVGSGLAWRGGPEPSGRRALSRRLARRTVLGAFVGALWFPSAVLAQDDAAVPEPRVTLVLKMDAGGEGRCGDGEGQNDREDRRTLHETALFLSSGVDR